VAGRDRRPAATALELPFALDHLTLVVHVRPAALDPKAGVLALDDAALLGGVEDIAVSEGLVVTVSIRSIASGSASSSCSR